MASNKKKEKNGNWPTVSSTYDHYRPQTKFAKVMFLSVCPSTGGGGGEGSVCLWSWGMTATPSPLSTHPLPSACWDTHTPLSSACWDTHTHTLVQCMLRYGQQAGGTHPIGMRVCTTQDNLSSKQMINRKGCNV